MERTTIVPESILIAIGSARAFKARHHRVLITILHNLHRWPEPRTELAQRFLAEATGLSRASVRRAVDELVAWSVLEVVEASGTRGGSFRFRPPATWSPIASGPPGRPANSGPPGRPTSTDPTLRAGPLVGPPDGPLVGPPDGPKRERERKRERDLSLGGPDRAALLEHANRILARYPHPKTGRVRSCSRLPDRRIDEILDDEAGGDLAALAQIVEDAVDGFVARKGLARHEPSGWDPWEVFELGSLLSARNITGNLDAARDARELGNVPPYRRGDHSRKRRTRDELGSARVERRRVAERREQRLALEVELSALSPDELLDRALGPLLDLPEGEFKRERIARVRRQFGRAGDAEGGAQ